jgi:hypothetical protein
MSDKHDRLRDWLIEEGIDLAAGQTESGLVCPYCLGGDHNDKSFSITRIDTGYLFHCYRAKCGASGIYSAQASSDARTYHKTFTPKTYDGETVALSEVQRSWFATRYGLTDHEIVGSGVTFNPAKDSYVFPIRDMRGYDVGKIDRTYAELGNYRKPKAITYWFNDVPKLYFPRMELFRTREVYIVEDNISAIRGARYGDTVACLSSHLTEKDAVWLSRYYDRAVFALDRDAVSKAIALSKMYGLVFRDGTRTLLLEEDIKDSSDDDVRRLYEN